MAADPKAPNGSGERAARGLTTVLEIPWEALTITAPPPDMISQRNVEAVTGIPARVYLEAIRSPGFPLPVARLGKLRLVERAAFLEYLRGLAAGSAGSGATAAPPPAPPPPIPARPPVKAAPRAPSKPDGVDAVLGELGCRRVASSALGTRERRRRTW